MINRNNRQALLLGLLTLHGIASAATSNPTASQTNPEYDYLPPVPGSYSLPFIKPAANGSLLDERGQPLALRDLTHGRITVLSFIYTRCSAAKACPYATGVLRQLHEATALDPALTQNLRLVSLSFDPLNDTPARMTAYSAVAARHPAAAPWHFVTTRSVADLQPILAAYGQAVDQKSNPRDPAGPLNHTLRVYLVDASGNIRNIYSSGTLDLRLVLADIKTLSGESSTSAAHTPPPTAISAAPQTGSKPDSDSDRSAPERAQPSS